MAMSKQQLWSLAVLVVMVGSLFAAITYDSKNGAAPSPGPNSPPPTQQDITQVSYTAKAVQAKVLQIFPTATLVGTTDALDVAVVDAALQKVPGIIALAGSEFFEPEDKSANFRTNIRVTSPDNLNDVLKAAGDSNIISKAAIFPTALVSIPGKIEFKNEDAGLTQDYSPKSAQAQVIVTLDTQKGDRLEVTLNSEFAGQNIINLAGYIERNLDSQPEFSSVDSAFSVSSLEGVFSLEGTATKLDAPGLGIIKGFFAEPDYNSGLSVKERTTETRFSFTPDANAAEADLNKFLTSYAGVDSFSINMDLNNASARVADAQDYKSFVFVLGEEMGKIGFRVTSIADPESELTGTVTVLSGGREKFLADVAQKERDTGIKLTVLQKARFDINSIFVPDKNRSYSLPGGSFSGFVGPTHLSGEDINMTVVLVGNARQSILQILDAHEANAGAQLPSNLFGG